MKINQMKKDEFFEGFYLIKTAEVRQTRAGKDYLALTFQDDTGEIEGKVWDAQPGKIKDFTAGTVVHMQGRREVYNNTPRSINWFFVCQRQASPTTLLISRKNHLWMSRTPRTI